ncbi:putative WW domain, FF domain, WW domain superfamily, FF domain superfamily protein [Helianthus annuus]|nr:pre-mRNA-processing protein 40A [Helianthus annuus]XP_022000981.1 pre-mRNA-processing protein 40A [Helianthus annuus]KAJ0570754.1 putative WW domain, FF domain, WW domain superfamily, FF domain superfamily protein [Helianthus annuus]KAJ0577694.1 putative WW domain, FF domain, WW domain superfamily, FF domain superfamily protein [Helianthus annuus]KAJ0585095.1 putative WW domain, FF domain, WW domain superfamily, FF domain superfamily protein [Helianthus annuus]KAJ0919559.1 putative WW domai
MANNSQYPGIQPPRPPVAAMGPPPNTYPPVAMQFRPAGPPRPPPPYMPIVSQQFLAVRPNMVSQPMQHLPPRPGPPAPPLAHSIAPPPPPPPAAQVFPVPDVQPIRPVMSVSPQAQQAVPAPNNYGPGQSGPRAAISLSYNLPTPAPAQAHVNAEVTSQYQPISSTNMHGFPLGGPAVTPMLQPAEVASSVQVTTDLPKAASDWIEHTSHKGKRYYYNKKTKISSWEKPLELMSPTERADASTNWKEYPAPDGRKYYYNKVTKQSKWKIPDELKLAREQVITKSNTNEQQSTKDPDNETLVPSLTPGSDSPSSQAHEPGPSPVPVPDLIPPVQSGSVLTSEPTASIESSKGTTNAAEETPMTETLPLSTVEIVSANNAVIAENGTIEEFNKGSVTNDSANGAALEEKAFDQETQVYEDKQEAKNAFKALLENANVASDWTWDQTMRVIINDRRYGALRSLSERKQAFTEFIVQKKKQEAEQRRAKHKKAREEFKKMLEESKEITVSTKWSKVAAIFEDDDRFKAIERLKDREDLYDDYITEREKKERSKALEEHKKNRKEYIEFLKSCDFLTASSQWRKVQGRLEADESCLRLEKVDRLEIFQEYIRDLEKDEEEQRKLRAEELRKTERKNRDEFRKLMDEHIASGMLTSKSHWRDYCVKVKESPAYLAVSSNSSGATPKDLFEDVLEELEKQYTEDRDRIKEIVKMRKVSILSTWTIEDFKNAIAEDISSQPVSDVNLKLVFDELLERAQEKEEKEVKRRKRVVDDFYASLTTYKEITSSSRWEDVKPLFEDRLESCVEESVFREMFDKYITELKKARDERKHREDKGKDRDRRTEKSRRDKNNKGKSDKRRRDHSRDSHRHSAERKKTKQLEQQSSASAEYESRHKRHKRDYRRDDQRVSEDHRHDDQRVAEDGELW